MARNKYPEVTVEKILDVAQRLFLEKGYDNTTIQDIVDHLDGLSKGAVYHHFKSKEEIMDAVGDRMFSANNPFEKVRKRSDLNGLQKLREAIRLNQSDEARTNMTIQSIPLTRNPRLLVEMIESNRRILTPYSGREVIKECQISVEQESAMGVASILGSLCVVVLAKKLQVRHLAIVLVSFRVSLIPCGIAFLLPVGAFIRYLILLIMFCACQLGCSLFSTYAISIIQQRTPDHLMGKVMSYVFTLSMCAQPAGQIVYGALFDQFAGSAYGVPIPSGLIVCLIGLDSSGFFAKFEKRQLIFTTKRGGDNMGN